MYEDNRYVYRRSNSDNYIKFNNELWKIVSIESDNTLKIMKNASIGKKPFVESGHRNNSNNTYCGSSCNA